MSDSVRPGLARATPRMPQIARDPRDLAMRMAHAAELHRLMGERRISNQEVAEAFRVSEKIVREMRSGLRPIPVHKIGLLPSDRLRAVFFDAFLAVARATAAA